MLFLFSPRVQRGVLKHQDLNKLYQDVGNYATERGKNGGKEIVEICLF
jgi:hypothetical protein